MKTLIIIVLAVFFASLIFLWLWMYPKIAEVIRQLFGEE